MSKLPLSTSVDLVKQLNTILELLNRRGHYILDWENADMVLDRIEYHAADGIKDGKRVSGSGDKSDNFYCYFEQIPKKE